MTYKEALDYIHSTRKFGWKLGLENIRNLLCMLGNPHEKLKYVHVAGTNGKGSTVAFISSVLTESGYKTGMFISPYIERFTERIQINGEEIPEDDLAKITKMVKECVDEMLQKGMTHPTEFEIVTAIGLQYFYEMNCDIVVLEVGLGGRFDSTNVINNSLVSVITSISYDHMDILGNTLPQIAFEKAGIIKENGDVVLYSQEKEVEEVIEAVCIGKKAKLHKVDFSKIKLQNFSIDGQIFDYGEYKNLKIGLLGKHQLKNAAVAIEACNILADKGYEIYDEYLRRGLEKAKWPGRMEIVCKSPLFIIDGAHNVEGTLTLAENLNTYFPEKKKILIMGVLKDKQYEEMIKIIVPLAGAVVAVTPLSERALGSEELSEYIKLYCKNVMVGKTIEDGIEKAINIYDGESVICAFGSLYYIGEVGRYFKNKHILLGTCKN